MAKSFPIPTHAQFQDLTGRRFSRWLVASYAGTRGQHHYWNCVCDCGTEKAVAKNSLTAKKSHSCGCLSSEKLVARWDRVRADLSACSVDGCDRPADSKGRCKLHYERVRRGNGIGPTDSTRGKRFRWIEQHVSHQGEDCLIWPYSVGDKGRGSVQVDKVIMSAPRAMCLLAHGEPPTPEHEAAHSCGKGHEGCVHPQHLSWKTKKENEADKIAHGTLRKGTDINTNKLTEQQVLDIRRRIAFETGVDLAEEFGVSPTVVSNIKHRKSWAWL